MDTSSSSSSSSICASSLSLSSSRLRFTPWSPSLSDFIPFAGGVGNLVGTVGVEVALFVDDGGALKMDCCSSEEITVAGATVGGRYTPSNLVKTSDLLLAYCILYAHIRNISIKSIQNNTRSLFQRSQNLVKLSLPEYSSEYHERQCALAHASLLSLKRPRPKQVHRLQIKYKAKV